MPCVVHKHACKYGRSSRRQLRVQLLQASMFITECCYQRLSAESEHRNAEDRFAIAVTEHSDPRADEDVDDRPIVGHLPRELKQGTVVCWRWTMMHEWVRGCFHCKVQYRRPSRLCCFHNISTCSNYTRTSHVRDVFVFYLMPNNCINNYFDRSDN